ncbi:cytochrome P450 2A13-like isoform X1 [Clavelina lepadiformis]|uniref:cytochrome P450 2A13-like isoform X1 n=1 Tax=Clavelina lepadiformis TaxID=159417 RepID=UPI0040430CD4
MLNYLIATVLALLIILILKDVLRSRNLPPGPRGIPFVGSIHKIVPNFHETIPLFAKEYGNIFRISVGPRTIICLVGYDIIKEILVDRAKEFSDRATSVIAKLCRGESRDGIASSPYGPKWSANRKFLLSTFRNLGLNKRGIEKTITSELPHLVEELHGSCRSGNLVDPSLALEYATLNVIASFTFGDRYDYGDKRFLELLHINNEFFQMSRVLRAPTLFLYSIIPYLHKLVLFDSVKQFAKAARKILDFVQVEVKRHLHTHDPQSPRDFIDCYITELKNNENQFMTEKGMEMSIMDLFQAGTETSSTTLRWAILFMANYPQVQEKVHDEIERVLGLQREVRYDDRMRMPYCEATILEVQRKASITPIGLVHAPSHDTTIRGYDIPKGSSVFISYHSMHFSPDHWKNPNQFDPENFLDADGSVGNRDAFMPFGVGLRRCAGIEIARQELFLYFVGILQKFDIQKPDDVKSIPEDPIVGLTLSPHPYKIVLRPKF